MLNRVTLIGHLGKDPEVRRLENGTPVGKFTIATNENYKDANGEWQSQTEWHDVIVWRIQAEQAEKTLKKGSFVFLEGKLTHRKYTDKNGIERYATEVVAAMFRSLDKNKSESGYFPSQEPPGTQYNRPNPEIAVPNLDNPMTQSVPFEVTNASEMKGATVAEAVAEPVGEDGLPF